MFDKDRAIPMKRERISQFEPPTATPLTFFDFYFILFLPVVNFYVYFGFKFCFLLVLFIYSLFIRKPFSLLSLERFLFVFFFFFGEIHFLLLFTGFRIFIHYTPFNHLIRGSISILK